MSSMMHQTAYGANRTMSTGLPSSYTLPSGDKIPSVALGNAPTSCSWNAAHVVIKVCGALIETLWALLSRSVVGHLSLSTSL